jgi:NADH:ubiquinone oxidoreductase subunit K
MLESGWKAIKIWFEGASVGLLKGRPIVVVLFNVEVVVYAFCILIYACKPIEGTHSGATVLICS